MKYPSFRLERRYWAQDHLIVGIDEVGRGALAGPLTVGAVCFDPRVLQPLYRQGINDSKLVSAPKRFLLATRIKTYAQAYSIASCSVNHINTHGITHATVSLIQKLLDRLRKTLHHSMPLTVFIDGKFRPTLRGIEHSSIVNIIDGDALSISVAAASIIAKVDRDEQMIARAKEYPHYGWERNKGYGTSYHLQAIRQHGASPLHRTLYLRKLL